MGRKSIRKGKQYERDVAQRFREKGWEDMWRNTSETQQGNDGDLRGREGSPWVIQCSHAKRISTLKKFLEAEEAASPGEIPVAFLKWHGGEEVVVMRPETFFELAQEAGV